MAWNYKDDDQDKQLIYDLRQIYAVNIVGETLRQIASARKTENYSLWWKLLSRDLFTEISQKLKKDEVLKVKDEIKSCRTILFNNSQAYLKKSRKAEEHESIEDALCKLERLMSRLMEKHKMFGAKEEAEPL